jgi:diguanylate cyclase (GGDEF)-like protein
MPKPVNLTVLRARMRTQLASKRQGDFLRSLTLADPLTALLNRRAFDETILEEWRRCRASHEPLSMILADLDHFKAFNDAYGHPAGDECLRAVAEVFRKAAQRPQDLVARYGGKNLSSFCRRSTSLLQVVARRVMAGLERLNLVHGASDTASRVTVSLGVASIVPGPQAPGILLSAADAFMYQAKNRGRDQFVSGMAPV